MGGSSAPPPIQANYSEALSDSLRAQVDLLRGTGDFEDTGGLAELLREYEAPVRQQTAQIDTDVLRQTLLGTEREFQVEQDPETGKFGIANAEVVTDEQGEPQTIGGGRYQIVQTSAGSEPVAKAGGKGPGGTAGVSPTYKILDTQTGGVTATVGGQQFGSTNPVASAKMDPGLRGLNLDSATAMELEEVSKQFRNLENTITEAGGDVDAAQEEIAKQFTFENPNTGEPLREGETITIRESDGMVDLLGDTRKIEQTVAQPDFEEYVRSNPEYMEAVAADNSMRQSQGLPTRTLAEWGEAHYNASGKAAGDEVPQKFVQETTGRQAGFDEQGKFLGSAALAEDIQAGQLSRQRERDISDVERLSGRFSDIMEDYKPTTTSGLAKAQDAILARGDELIGDKENGVTRPITEPTALSKVGTEQNYQMMGEAGLGQVDNQDTLRQALLGQAKSALSDGLTAREQQQIEQASRARQTAAGRIFDPSSTIQEAQAVIEEDRNRQMQNRAFAQSALGQEAALQTGDVTREMTADQFDVGAKMDAQRLNEQLRQQGLLGYVDAVARTAQLEDQYTLDPFRAILGRGGGGSLSGGQGVLGSAMYGLQSGPQYLNPEAGLGYQSNMYTNQANMFAAQQSADANRQAGLFGGLGSLGGGIAQGLGTAGKLAALCWVAREVYGPMNPQWLMFREWMFKESPKWFFNLYIEYGERFANWISNKPRIKSVIRKWMDSKIRG